METSPKVDSPQDNNDFRLISILPVLSKIYERLVHNQVVEFLENHHLLEDNNSGFRKGHSTTSVLLSIRDDILKAIKNRSEWTLLVLAQWLERPTGISGRSWVRLPLGNSEKNSVIGSLVPHFFYNLGSMTPCCSFIF